WQVAASRVEPDLGLAGRGPATVLLFAAGVSLTAVTLVLDQALVGLLRGELQLVRNAVFALVKLLALLAAGAGLADRGVQAIYETWAGGQVLSLLALAALAS